MKDLFEQACASFQRLQQEICAEFAALETSAKEFHADEWSSKLGQGHTNVLEGGQLWEKVGVAFSKVSAAKLPASATERNPQLAGKQFQASGLSIVAHPLNPHVPTSHCNIRVFVVDDKNWWFGGGFDLTPYYISDEDCAAWHKAAQAACDKFDPKLYPELKQNCDDYFYLPHRKEARGIGGIFFDDFCPWGYQRCLEFALEVGGSYKDAYAALAKKLMGKEYGDREREFQLYRRGRYVEFNLLYDRGTLFGIQSGGRTESILMSLPPAVSWSYNRSFAADSPEGRLSKLLARE